MNAECPSCGYQFKVRRRPDGSGSIPIGPISSKEVWLLNFIKAFGVPMNRKKIQELIYPKGVPHETLPKGWSDHVIQVTLSTLVGRGLVTMRKKGQAWEYWAPKVLA